MFYELHKFWTLESWVLIWLLLSPLLFYPFDHCVCVRTLWFDIGFFLSSSLLLLLCQHHPCVFFNLILFIWHICASWMSLWNPPYSASHSLAEHYTRHLYCLIARVHVFSNHNKCLSVTMPQWDNCALVCPILKHNKRFKVLLIGHLIAGILDHWSFKIGESVFLHRYLSYKRRYR